MDQAGHEMQPGTIVSNFGKKWRNFSKLNKNRAYKMFYKNGFLKNDEI